MLYSAIRVPAKALPATAAVIMIHGLGDSGAGWQFLADLARQHSQFDHVKFVFPNAPTIPLTATQGMEMPSWFDVRNLPRTAEYSDVTGFMKSVDVVKELIKEQVDTGIPPEKIIVGGFSQGAALSLSTAATLEYKIGGFMVLSGFSPISEALIPHLSKANVDTPIYEAHGTADPVIPYKEGQDAFEFMKKNVGFTKHEFHTFPGMVHSTCQKELDEIFEFFQKILL